MRLRHLVLGAMLPLALLADCSSSGSGKAAANTGGPGDAATATRTIDVSVGANGYTPATIDVTKGETVTFNVTNTDSTVHEFVLGGAKVQDGYEKTMAAMSKSPMEGMADAPNLIEVKAGGPAKAITWTFPDAATTVIYGSHQPGDYAKGLKGTITVK